MTVWCLYLTHKIWAVFDFKKLWLHQSHVITLESCFSPLQQLLVTQEVAGAFQSCLNAQIICVSTRIGFVMEMMTVAMALMNSSLCAVRNIFSFSLKHLVIPSSLGEVGSI